MKKGKTRKLTRRILSFVLTTALVVGLMPGNVMTVRAEESSSTELSVTAFATPEQLMSSDNFALHTDYTGVAQKVYFGMNGESQQIWYIAGGEDHDGDGKKDSIVLLCDPLLPMATDIPFEDQYDSKTYDGSWGCTYETNLAEDEVVYPNHYGASYLRRVLQGYTGEENTEKFSAAEKELMQTTRVYTDDDKQKDDEKTEYTYYTEDKLYAAYGDHASSYFTVGANSADSLNGGLKVSLTSAPYNSIGAFWFWLRAPHYDKREEALFVVPDSSLDEADVFYNANAVVPAFRLNLSSVLFASAATAATSDASLTDTMTFRVDGDDKITSQAYYSTDNVIVDAVEEETVYLYVQGNDGTNDWVYSQEISEDSTIATDTIKSGAKDRNGSAVSLTSVDLSRCEIWLEKKVAEDNLVYAVMAKETIATVAVTDITAPVAGAELDVAATCNTTGVSTTTPTVSYTKNGESVSGNANYLADYTAVVELEAEDGYTFTDETTATINGNEASVSYDADTGKLTVSYTFDKTAKLPLGNAYYVTKDELMSSFDLDGSEDAVGKVYFGTNGTGDGAVSQSWYIAGSDADNSIVLLCDPMLPLATGKVFEDSTANKTYDDNWGCTYDSAPSEVYSNHYGASDFRLTTLKGLETGAFTESEQSMMLETTVYTNDRIDSNYSTTDTLYAAYGEHNGRYITVGANSAENLNGGLKVSLSSLPYNTHNLPFWLRTRHYNHSGYAQVVPSLSLSTDARPVNETSAVVPAFRLNLSSVLFVSAATAATSGASIETGAYGFYVFSFRMDGTEKLVSEAVYTEDGVMVNYDAADSTDGGQVYLYVQDADSVYSVAITEDTTEALASMTGIDSLTDESTKIWLEKSEDNLTYAVMAGYHENHVDAGNDGYCDVCGTKKDGISATLAGHSVSLGGQIGMNFYMDLDASVLEDESAYMLFTLPDDSTQKVYVKDIKTSPVTINGKTYYVFTCKVDAREMADTITAKMVCEGGTKEGTEYTYSVREYAEALMQNNNATQEQKTLAKAMLNYGAYAQKYFDPNVAAGELANVNYPYEAGEFTVTTSGMKNYVPTVTNNSATLDYVGSTLILEADIKVRHYFKLKDGQTYSGNLTQYVAPQANPVDGTYYYYESDGITAAALGDMSTPYTGVEGISISYCPLSYVTTVLANNNQELTDDTALQNLMKALYLYYGAVAACN